VPKTNTAVAEISDQKDIFISKEFFSGDELSNVETVKTNKTGIDSISFNIYKERKNNNSIFSLERFLKNDDVEKYRIIDTINLESADVKVIIENAGSNKIFALSFLEDNFSTITYLNVQINNESLLHY